MKLEPRVCWICHKPMNGHGMMVNGVPQHWKCIGTK